MSAANLAPRARIMAVCDGIRESRTERGVFHLKGVRHGCRGRKVPFVAEQLWLFLILSSPRPGIYPGYVLIVNADTEKAIFYGTLSPNPQFRTDTDSLGLGVHIGCTFPAAGRYLVQLWFFQNTGSDIIKGELPFSVSMECLANGRQIKNEISALRTTSNIHRGAKYRSRRASRA
jgi:hypothetical protein